jgi:hypothetical protein
MTFVWKCLSMNGASHDVSIEPLRPKFNSSIVHEMFSPVQGGCLGR